MSWHHIIPASVLAGVWNSLVDRHVGTHLPEARVALRQYTLLASRNLPDVDRVLDRMRAGSMPRPRTGHGPLAALDVVEVHQLTTAVVWPPWNIVEGPSNRSDDPKDECLDRFTYGLSAGETTSMRAIELLYSEFENFPNAGSVPGPAALRALSTAISRYRQFLICDGPIRYRPEMWVRNADGSWRKRRGGDS
jgi:hypothetical protein